MITTNTDCLLKSTVASVRQPQVCLEACNWHRCHRQHWGRLATTTGRYPRTSHIGTVPGHTVTVNHSTLALGCERGTLNKKAYLNEALNRVCLRFLVDTLVVDGAVTRIELVLVQTSNPCVRTTLVANLGADDLLVRVHICCYVLHLLDLSTARTDREFNHTQCASHSKPCNIPKVPRPWRLRQHLAFATVAREAR